MCPVCGYQQFVPYDEHGATTFDICPSCGCESGYAYDQKTNEAHYRALRALWIKVGEGKWWSRFEKPPRDWSPIEQMKQAGLEYEEET